MNTTKRPSLVSPEFSQSHAFVTNYRVAHFALSSSVLPLVQDALPFAEQVRRALIRNRADTEHSEVITGKTVDGVPLEGHGHSHYLPADEDGDGRLDHVTVYAPRGFEAEDLAALGALRTIYRRGNRPEVRMVLAGLGTVEAFAREAESPTHFSKLNSLFGRSRRWRSVTPFSLPRFATRGAGKPARLRDLPEAQVVRELRVRGLPEPISIRRIEGYSVSDRPLVRWLEFQTRRFKGEEGHGLAGFELEFAEEVSGPVALGFACHFGLGLFMPA
ncbi:MAG: type I-U CRISPR-associated protein Cas5/Cas6 [Acidobacteria bacterium]|nr:type I-U CRISPR-associated protein Cas5/Cas6 [Acidobacteriota bacterium]